MLNENAATDKEDTHYIVAVLHKLCSCAQLCSTNSTNPRADKTPAAPSLEFHTKKIHKNLTQITFFLSPWLNFPRRIFSPSTWSKKMAAERSEKTSHHKFPRFGFAITSTKNGNNLRHLPLRGGGVLLAVWFFCPIIGVFGPKTLF